MAFHCVTYLFIYVYKYAVMLIMFSESFMAVEWASLILTIDTKCFRSHSNNIIILYQDVIWPKSHSHTSGLE